MARSDGMTREIHPENGVKPNFKSDLALIRKVSFIEGMVKFNRKKEGSQTGKKAYRSVCGKTCFYKLKLLI
jgi:hypothetical protein